MHMGALGPYSGKAISQLGLSPGHQRSPLYLSLSQGLRHFILAILLSTLLPNRSMKLNIALGCFLLLIRMMTEVPNKMANDRKSNTIT